MKILFVGYFHDPWSTHHPFIDELRKNHQVTAFDFRYKPRKKFQQNEIYQKFHLIFDKVFLPIISKCFKTLKFYIYGNWKKNRELLFEVKRKSYDLVLIFKAETINYKLIPKVNKYSKTFYYFMDQLSNAIRLDAHKYASFSNWSSASFSDVTQFFRREGANCYHMIEGFHTKFFKPSKEHVKKEIDIIFVGSISSKRKDYISFLRKSKINVVCFGNGWDNEPIYLEELSSNYKKSKIALNFTRGKIGISDRVVCVLGSGSFLISEYCNDIKKFFKKGIHLEWFKTKEELLELINFFLENDEERESIARSGSEFVFKNYTWKKYFEKLLIFSKR